MKPFNLDKALAGDPVVTRSGLPVYDLFLGKHMESKGETYPVIGIVGDESIADYWTKDGVYNVEDRPSENDLFMPSEIMFAPLLNTGGVIHLPGGNSLYKTEQEVSQAWGSNEKFVRVVEVHL